MTEQRYHQVQHWFKSHSAAHKTLGWASVILPSVVYVSYILMVFFLLITQDFRLFRAVFIPAAVFLGGTLFRRLVNAPRPYEVYGTPPLVPKEKKGESFPSRHMFSASVIAACGYWLFPPLGWLLISCAVLLAPVRVLAGIHFIKDVAVGGILGGLIGWLGFFVL